MDYGYDGKVGESKEGGMAWAARRIADMTPGGRRSCVWAAVSLCAAVCFLTFIDPAAKSLGEASRLRAKAAEQSEKAREAWSAAKPSDDGTRAAREKAEMAERQADSAEAAAREREAALAAGPDLPATVAQAAGAALAGVSTDGPGWPVEYVSGKWLHRLEARIVSDSWETVSESAKAAEAASGPTARALAVDIGRTADGRIAARLEWSVVSTARDWVARVEPRKGGAK